MRFKITRRFGGAVDTCERETPGIIELLWVLGEEAEILEFVGGTLTIERLG